jgi:hypothetical protein
MYKELLSHGNYKKEVFMWTILDRLKEPSTYAGLSGIMIAVGLTAEQWTMISTAAAAVAGLVAMVLREKKS